MTVRIHLTSAQWARKGPRNTSARTRITKSKKKRVVTRAKAEATKK